MASSAFDVSSEVRVMTEEPASSAGLSEVLRLTGALADQVLDAQIMQRAVPDEQIRALANAALLLEEHAIPLPPMLMQVLHDLGKAVAPIEAAEAGERPGNPQSGSTGNGPQAAKGFSRFMRTFRGKPDA